MTNGSPDPKQRSWTQVGGFMYHFARVEQKINQAVIKLTELDAKSAPVVELIDFAKKVDLGKTVTGITLPDGTMLHFTGASNPVEVDALRQLAECRRMRLRLKDIKRSPRRSPTARGDLFDAWTEWAGVRFGEPGSPNSPPAMTKPWRVKVDGPKGTLQSLLDGYQQSSDFLDRRERTKTDYKQKIKQIEEQFGDFPIAALSDRRSRGVFMGWRDQLALKSRRQADYAWQVLALILQWALDRGTITHNPCARGGRLYQSGVRIEKIWTHEHEAAFLNQPQLICICRCCSACGPRNAKAIC